MGHQDPPDARAQLASSEVGDLPDAHRGPGEGGRRQEGEAEGPEPQADGGHDHPAQPEQPDHVVGLRTLDPCRFVVSQFCCRDSVVYVVEPMSGFHVCMRCGVFSDLRERVIGYVLAHARVFRV